MGREVKIRPIFAWYDLWVGLYVDRANRRLYFLPIPMFGVVIEFPPPAPSRLDMHYSPHSTDKE